MIRIDGTFDIECADWDRFCLGCVYTEGAPRIFYDPDAMIDYMAARGGTFWGHAAGIYDTIFVAKRLTERGVRYAADESDHRITRLVCGSLQLRDSYALFPAPLDELCGMLGRAVPSLPWGCTCGHACGGYCQIGPRAAEGDPDLEAYCIADCRDLFDGLHYLAERAAHFGIDCKGTLGNTAWSHAQTSLGLPDADIPWRVWRKIRRADKSGRLAVVRPTSDGPGCHWDMINAYPSALAELALPVGALRELGARDSSLALGRSRPGIYNCTVTVPDDAFLPPLPWRCGNRVVYPTGEITGSWCLPEIIAAVERGCRVVETISSTIWATAAPIFDAHVRQLYDIRRQVGRHTPLGQWFSRMAKALTGKFAEDPERARILCNPESLRVCMREGACRNGCTGRCRAYEQIDLLGKIWSAPYWKLSASAHVQWSAYLRAQTRIAWLAQAERFGTSLVYGNTDSLWTIGRGKPTPIGEDLGHWELKHTWSGFTCRAPNIYRWYDDHDAAQIRAAGSHSKITDTDWSRGGGVVDRGVEGFRQGARSQHGLFVRKHRRWTLPEVPADGMYGDRKLDANSGITYPLSADQWRTLTKKPIRPSPKRSAAKSRSTTTAPSG